MRNQVFKKLFSVLLALIMVAGLLPASVLAEGEGNADSTPAPTEAVQPTESAEPTAPTETETPEVTEVPAPTPENPATTVEPTQGEPTAEPTDEGIMPANVMPVQASVAARDISKDGFIRIFHLDCGRKYFSVSEINGIIDQLAENNYTHIQLAFGNDGLRFLLNDMSVTVNGNYYDSDSVKNAIKSGNSQLTTGSSGELSQSEMESIISHANDKGIKVIPLFNAPGHMYAVVKAMNILGVNGKYIQVSDPYDAPRTSNWAVDPTDANAVAFAEALLGKYAAYFESKGSTMFNIGADESGINDQNYAAYAAMVNAMNSIVKNAGMTTLAYNDGIYNTSFASSQSNVAFDNDIVICYWTSGANSESVENLLQKGFKILNNSDNWYYVLGDYLYQAWWPNGQWGYNDALNGIENTPVTMMKGYNGNAKPIGSILCVWCDAPNQKYEPEKVYNLIRTMAAANPDYFKKEAANVPAVEISENETNVKTTKETVDGKTVYKAAVKADGTSTIQLKVVNIDNTVNWASDNNDIATVDENGLVTFKGAAGTVTITATPVAATRSINETAAYSITFNVTKEGEVPQIEKDITVVEGGTATDVIEGYNYSNTDQTGNPDVSIATVESIVGQQGQPGTVKYNKKSVMYNALAGNNTSWTKTEYFYTPDNGANYYPVYAYRSRYYYYYGYSVNDGTNDVKHLGSSWDGNDKVDVYERTGTEAVPASTTVTFKGVAEGTTSATIGHVKYNITVTKEDVTNVSPLPVQLWITNNPIEVDTKTYSGGSTSGSFRNNNTWSEEKAWYVNVSAVDAYGVNGVALSKVLPASMQRYENNITYWIAKQTDKKEVELALWSGKVHTKTNNNIQMVWGADYSNDGDEFNYIRYYSGKWEVSATGNVNDWKEVKGTGSTENYSVCTEQLAVYYMIRSEITEEITTDVADWGYMSSDKDYANQINTEYYVMLDFAVKIDGADRKPSSFPQADKTFVFHCNRNDTSGAVQNDSSSNLYRRLNNFRAVDNLGENYEVYKVTVTMTNDGSSNSIQNTNSYAYEGKEQIIWAIDEDVRNASGLNNYVSISGADSVYSGCKIGGDPYIRGVEVYNQHGALITYYIRAKAVLSNLRVHYRIEGSDKDFYSYGIIAGENVVFGKDFGKDENSATLLKDNVITDSDGHIITVTAKLEKVDGMGAQYKYGNYKFNLTAREDKDVYLYYTFDANVTFVVDFGLPLKIMPKDVAPNLANANIESVTASSQMSRYADVTIGDNYSIIYTLKSMISDADLVSVTYEGTNLTTSVHDSAAFNIHIIPATNVYYEDSFAKFTDGSGTAAGATWTIVKNDGGTLDEQQQKNSYTNQALEALGNKTNVYGYDPKYDSCTMFSMGSARKVTVTSDMVTNWNDTTSAWPTAQFTFKGTGFDIISLTDNTSGAIFVDVVNAKTGVKAKSLFVNNYYGYKYNEATQTWETVQTGNNALYQIPVIAVRDLGYDEYNVVISVAYNTFFDKTTKQEYSFWLDAVRVYDPMGKDNAIYNTGNEKEGYPQYIKLRSELIKLGESAAGALFIDGKENANISEYANYGPNNEVYLANGQAIMFKLNVGNANIETIQIGAKAPMSEGTAKLNVNNTDVVENGLSTATEMYYKISQYGNNTFTITNTGKNILSLTNLKITFTSKPDTEVTLAKLSEAEQQDAVATVRALFAPAPVEPEPEPEPEKTFEPERFEASWSRNVMQGRKATLTVKTSEDVEAITVDGQTIRSYRTRTERMGFGRRAKRITYREFTYSMVAQESADFSVTAINAEGTESEAITARLTVKTRPNSLRDMWDWFKGWF